MAINENLVLTQKKALEEESATLLQVKRSLGSYRTAMNKAWAGPEMTHVNTTVDKLSTQCEQLSKSLKQIAQDVSTALEEVLEEEAETEAVEAAAAEAEGK